tara:strand:- start:1541 stop:2341 length:801 start_codon:yes stop_codon:yes gene_type:complete
MIRLSTRGMLEHVLCDYDMDSCVETIFCFVMWAFLLLTQKNDEAIAKSFSTKRFLTLFFITHLFFDKNFYCSQQKSLSTQALFMAEWTKQFKIIKEKIDKIFSEHGYTFSHAKAEQYLGVSRNKWSSWKRGQRPNADDLEAIARKLDLNPTWLLLGEGTPENETATEPTKPFTCCPPGPVSKAVMDIEEVMQGTSRLDVLKAAIAKLEAEYSKEAVQEGGYGRQLKARERTSFHEPAADYPDGNACGVDAYQQATIKNGNKGLSKK